MAGGITINGRSIDNAEDQELLKQLLDTFPNAHNGDLNIDPDEAVRIMDADKSGLVDEKDLLKYFDKDLNANAFNRTFRLFSGIDILRSEYSVQKAGIMFIEMGEDDPWEALKFADRYRDQPYAAEVLEKAARNATEKDPWDALEFADRYRDQPYAAEVLEKAARNAAETHPRYALEFADRYRDQTYAADVINIAAENDPTYALAFAYNYKYQPYGAEVLEKAARTAAEKYSLAALADAYIYKYEPYGAEVLEKAARTAGKQYPGYALNFADQYKNEPYAAEIIEEQVLAAPSAAIEYQDNIYDILKSRSNSICQVIVRLIDTDGISYDEKKSISTLAHKLTSELNIDDALAIVRDDRRYMNALIELSALKNVAGRFDVDKRLRYFSLMSVQRMNDLHSQRDSIRFRDADWMGMEGLYTLMVYAEEEVFTSTFGGLFNRLLELMKKKGVSGDKLLERLGHNRFRTFIRLCASYNRLNEFLSTMPESERRILLESFVSDIEKSDTSLSDAVIVADTFAAIDDPKTLFILQERIKEEYERVSSQDNNEATTIYGLLAGMFGNKAVIDESWFKDTLERYSLPDVTGIKQSELFNPDGTNIQQYFFYEDDDGKASFASFLKQYKDKPSWKVEDKGNYVVIRSDTVGGKRIEMYANKPTEEAVEKGPDEIQVLFKQRHVESIVVVHRGHSYHAQKTIDRIPKIAKIVSLGSCGGYNNVAAVLENAPDAHIISTKGTGTMIVNDPLFKMLNETILKEDISWPQFWAKAKARFELMKDFKDYIPPHRNLGVLFLKAYNRLADPLAK